MIRGACVSLAIYGSRIYGLPPLMVHPWFVYQSGSGWHFCPVYRSYRFVLLGSSVPFIIRYQFRVFHALVEVIGAICPRESPGRRLRPREVNSRRSRELTARVPESNGQEALETI
jgi:hypothetical protein